MNDLRLSAGTVSVSRGEMEYIKFGTGEKSFVIIGGMNMTGLKGLGGFISEAYKMFAEEYTVYLFDRLKVLPEGYTVREMSDDIAELMDLFGIECAEVMGNSQGGMIAQYLAIDHHEKVNSLVLCATMSRMGELGTEVLGNWAELGRKKDGAGIYRDFFRYVYQRPDMKLCSALAKTATDEQCTRFAVLADACLKFDSYDELYKINCPVFVIGSEHDRVLGGDRSTELAEKLDCRIYMYPEAEYGHNFCDEAPDYKQRVMDFLHSLDR